MGGYFYILPVVFQLICSSVLVQDLRRLAELGLQIQMCLLHYPLEKYRMIEFKPVFRIHNDLFWIQIQLRMFRVPDLDPTHII